MDRIAEVEIRKIERIQYFKVPSEIDVNKLDYVIIEFFHGTIDWAKIYRFIEEKRGILGFVISGKVLRKLEKQDLITIQENNEKKKETIEICKLNVEKYKLPIKLLDVEYSFDRTKLSIYFRAEHRVDFRDLVKELAKIFNCRIELKQIGLRDEAKLKGGCGICGMELCCWKFLKRFDSITMRMVKNQKLPMDMNKITGLCGRLLCCLTYEDEIYRKEKVEK